MDTWELITGITGIVAATIVSIVSLVVSIRNDKKLASKEHDLAEGLKSEILELLAIFSSIQYKRILMPHVPNDVLIEEELVALTKNRLTAGYVYLANCIEDKDDRKMFEVRYQMILNNREDIDIAARFSRLLLETLCKQRKDAGLGKEIPQIIMNMYEDENLKELNPQIPSEFERFVHFLIGKGITDPDVWLFHGIFEDNVNIVKKALDDGANTKCTDIVIKERYGELYEEFKNKEFAGFIKYLLDKQIGDYDVLLSHGTINGMAGIVKEALDNGADPNCTDTMIIRRYQKEYTEYLLSKPK